MRAIVTDAASQPNPALDVAPADGRSARSQRTRDAVVDALLQLLRGGNLRPTAKEIAEAAGTSLRSVYVHFDDLDDLFCSAALRQGAAVERFIQPVSNSGPFPERLDAFVTQRCAVWEGIGHVWVAAMLQEPFSPGLAALLLEMRTIAARYLRHVFKPEIAALPDESRSAVLAACDALSSTTTWDHWRRLEGHSVEESQAIVREGLARLLTGGRQP